MFIIRLDQLFVHCPIPIYPWISPDILHTKINFLFSSGIENNPTIFYQLIRGSTDQTNKYDTFYVQQRTENGWTYADVKVGADLY